MRELELHGNISHIRVSGDDLDNAIDDFLGDYELLNTAYNYELINRDMAWDAFTYELEKALQDRTIRPSVSSSLRSRQSLALRHPPPVADDRTFLSGQPGAKAR
jgi:hypothetical protein